MDTKVCTHCGGSGECLQLSPFAGLSSGEADLVPCPVCRGSGQVSLEPSKARPQMSPRDAMRHALEAIEKVLSKKKKR